MDNGPSVIVMILALLAGVTIFVVALRLIRKLKEEKRLPDRHNTTSLRMAKVLNASVEEPDETASGADAATEAEDESPSESADEYDDEPAEEVADESAGEYAEESAVEYADESADEYADEYAEESADEYVEESADGDAQSGGGLADTLGGASSIKPFRDAGQGFAVADEDDFGDETRETQAVSLADVMASDDDEDEPAPREPVGMASSVRPIRMQPIQPLRTLMPSSEDKAEGRLKSAGVSKRRLPETVKMKERKVLMAEDVKVHRELIEMFFDGSGVKFEFAENGRDACDLFEDNPDRYSLILMDIHMPVMDGYEAAREIRAMEIDWAKQIPIVAMTADATEEDLNRCFEAGMDDHVAKPIDMAVLQDRVFEFVTRDSE